MSLFSPAHWFSSRHNLKFLRFLLFLIVDTSANIPSPLKTKSTIVILTKYPFQRGVKCLQNTDTNRNNLFIIIFIQDTHITNVFFSGVLHDTIINKIYLYKYIQLIISQWMKYIKYIKINIYIKYILNNIYLILIK
jgi:hypothetical protein